MFLLSPIGSEANEYVGTLKLFFFFSLYFFGTTTIVSPGLPEPLVGLAFSGLIDLPIAG